MTDLLFREARAGDAEAITAFQVAMALETEGMRLDPPTCAAGVKAVLQDPKKGRYYVGERGGSVVCSLLLTYEWSDWRNGTVWWIQSVYVVPAERRKKTFSSLYDHVRKLATEATGVRGLRLYVEKENTVAQKAYEKLGMNGERYSVYEWMKEC